MLTDGRLRFVLGALAASGAADGFGPLTLSFAVLRVTGSVSRLGLVLAAQATAALALTLAGGVAADRFPRGRILICSLAGRTAAAGLLAITLLTGTASFPLLLAAAAGYGCADGLWLLTGQWLVFSMLTLAPVTVLGPALAQRYLGGAAAWGVVSASLALGAVAGRFGAGRIRPPRRPGLAMAVLMPIMTAEALALGLGAPLGAVAGAAVVTGLAMGVQAVFFATAMQASVRPDVLARVAAIDLLGSEGGQPAGYALAGPAAAAVGAHAFLTASAVVMAVAGTAFAFLPALRADASAGRPVGVE